MKEIQSGKKTIKKIAKEQGYTNTDESYAAGESEEGESFEKEMKKLKEKLVVYYNKYKNSDGWDSMDKEVFWDLFDDYEARGGDGFIHSKVEPVMRELKVIDKE